MVIFHSYVSLPNSMVNISIVMWLRLPEATNVDHDLLHLIIQNVTEWTLTSHHFPVCWDSLPRLAATGMAASMKQDEETVVFKLEVKLWTSWEDNNTWMSCWCLACSFYILFNHVPSHIDTYRGFNRKIISLKAIFFPRKNETFWKQTSRWNNLAIDGDAISKKVIP